MATGLWLMGEVKKGDEGQNMGERLVSCVWDSQSTNQEMRQRRGKCE